MVNTSNLFGRGSLLAKLPVPSFLTADILESLVREICQGPRDTEKEKIAFRKRLPFMTRLGNGHDSAVNLYCTFGHSQRKPILFMAHYDTVPGTVGADDNASGVAMLLALMLDYVRNDSTIPVCFLLTDLEEPPYFGTELMGSYQFFKRYDPSLFSTVVNLDCVGRYVRSASGHDDERVVERAEFYGAHVGIDWFGDMAGCIYDSGDRVTEERFADSAERLYPVRVNPVPHGGLLTLLSDLRWVVGKVPAAHVSDVALFGGSSLYHTPEDTPDTLDYERMADTACAVYSMFLQE